MHLLGQTGRKLQGRINEHRKACKTQDSGSKLFQHSLDLDHSPDSRYKVLVSNFSVLSKHLFIEGFYTKTTKYSINEAADVPSEYVIFT